VRRSATVIAHALAALLLSSAYAAEAEPVRPEWAPPAEAPPSAQGLIYSPTRDAGAALSWRYRRVSIQEVYVSGALALATVGAIATGAGTDGWRGGIAFDDDARRSLRLRRYSARRQARDASDALLALSVAYPVLGDGVLAASWYHGSSDVAEQILLIDTETLALTFAVQATVASLAGRERPYGRDCGGEVQDDSSDCKRNDRYRSFFSGHAAGAFAGASLSCMHHLHLPLYGGGGAEVASCAAGYAAATATATLRVVGDMHYVSDIFFGAAWGTAAGLGVPWFLHYGRSPAERRAAAGGRVHVVPHPGGLAVGGSF
jgi:membrane-associated phospholipid phosphatase